VLLDWALQLEVEVLGQQVPEVLMMLEGVVGLAFVLLPLAAPLTPLQVYLVLPMVLPQVEVDVLQEVEVVENGLPKLSLVLGQLQVQLLVLGGLVAAVVADLQLESPIQAAVEQGGLMHVDHQMQEDLGLHCSPLMSSSAPPAPTGRQARAPTAPQAPTARPLGRQ
jgi:hypothetical protein